MKWAAALPAPYQGDAYQCNACSRSGSGFRWNCLQCADDYCPSCCSSSGIVGQNFQPTGQNFQPMQVGMPASGYGACISRICRTQ
eukprot:228235-Rhodomonas_salina.2